MSATDDNINAIMAMGFPKDQAVIALNRSGNDVNAAADLLSRGVELKDDAEFDLIAAAGPEPAVHPPTVFKPRTRDDNMREEQFDTPAEARDSRITHLKEMGFTAEEAERALEECNQDFNEALTKLLATKDG